MAVTHNQIKNLKTRWMLLLLAALVGATLGVGVGWQIETRDMPAARDKQDLSVYTAGWLVRAVGIGQVFTDTAPQRWVRQVEATPVLRAWLDPKRARLMTRWPLAGAVAAVLSTMVGAALVSLKKEH